MPGTIPGGGILREAGRPPGRRAPDFLASADDQRDRDAEKREPGRERGEHDDERAVERGADLGFGVTRGDPSAFMTTNR